MFRLKGVTSTSRAFLDRMALSIELKLGSLQLGDVLRHASVLHDPKPVATYLISMYDLSESLEFRIRRLSRTRNTRISPRLNDSTGDPDGAKFHELSSAR